MKLKKHTPLLVILFTTSLLQAQMPTQQGAITQKAPPTGSLGVRIENSSRSLDDDGISGELDMLRFTVSVQTEILPGVFPWAEAGWHDPELQSVKSDGGFTWGLGVKIRPFLWPLKSDPVLGPRDWLACTLDLVVRGGEADIDADSTTLEWLNIEGVAGIEWHQKFLGWRDGPIGSYDVTSGAGIIFNQTEATRGSFDGSEDASVGIRLYTGFSFGIRDFTRLEADLYGSSDRRISLISGFRF